MSPRSRRLKFLIAPTAAAALAATAVCGGYCTYARARERSQELMRRSLAKRMELIDQALLDFRKKCGRFPLTTEGLYALSARPADVSCPSYPKRGFIPTRVIANDPWGAPFVYSSRGQRFVLESMGPDERPIGRESRIAIQASAVSVR